MAILLYLMNSNDINNDPNIRPLAFLDTETTGRYPGMHELLEIGVVIARADNLAMMDSFAIKVKPEHIEKAEPEALAVNRWNEEEWRDALPIAEAIKIFGERARGATPVGWNVSFDRSFLEPAMNRLGLVLDDFALDYTWRDIKMDFIRWAYLTGQEEKFAPRFSLSSAMRYFGISADDHHRALPDAIATWQMAQRLEEEFAKLKIKS